MLTVVLYIVTGLTLYAGGHHLFLAGNRALRSPNLQLGLLYLLLAGFALASALAYQPPSQNSLIPAGKLAIGLGIMLWLAVVWFIAFRTAYKPALLLDLLTAVWLIFLINNLGSPGSLLYTAPTMSTLQPSISPWWTAVEITMLASLAFAAYATYRLYQSGNKDTARLLTGGLALLGLVTLYDHLVSLEWISAVYLTPFGFLGFLAFNSLSPVVTAWKNQRKPKPAPMIYSLSFNPDRASFHTDISELRTPLSPASPSCGKDEDGTGTGSSALPVNAHEDIEDVEHAASSGDELLDEELEQATRPAEPPIIDQSTLNTITDDLIDIAVYATMALNRFRRGDADPATLESLCKKIRTRAIKTRRLANQLSSPDKVGYDGKTPTDD